MRVPVQDQTYVISRRDHVDDHDPDPRESEPFWVDAHTDTLYVRCLSEDAETYGVDLEVGTFTWQPDEGDYHGQEDGWDAAVTGVWEVTEGPVVVATLEQEEIAELFPNPGRYRYLYRARRTRDPEPGEPLEEHCLFVWELVDEGPDLAWDDIDWDDDGEDVGPAA